jgi:DNA invertase Pin-like site-specific DNA recombinase
MESLSTKMSVKKISSVIAVVRVSTDKQDVQRQRRDVDAAAKAHDLKIARTLEFEGLSGTKMLTNTEVRRVLNDLSRPDIDGIVVSSIDRLIRPDTLGSLSIFDSFQKTKKLIFTPGQIIDLNTQAGFLLSGIMGIIAGIERQMIMSRLNGGKETVRLRGGSPDSSAAIPRGLSYSKSTGWKYLEPDASLIRRAYDLLFEGYSWDRMVAEIGNGWSYEGIRGTLRNTVWKGIRTYTKGRETPLQVPMGIEPLISPERWEAAQVLLDKKTATWKKHKKPSRFLASGLLTCSCGAPMYIRVSGEWKSGKRNYYFCSTGFPGRGPKCGAPSIFTEIVDSAITEYASTQFPNAAFLKTVLKTLAANQPAQSQDADKLARERGKLESQRERLVRLTTEGTFTEADFKREDARIQAALQSYDALMPSPVPALDPRKLVEGIGFAFGDFRNQPFSERRGILQSIVKTFAMDNSNIVSMTLNPAFVDRVNLSSPSRS